MSGLMECCADMERETGFLVNEITGLDTITAAEWMDLKIRKLGKNEKLEFPLALLPRTGLACYRKGVLKAAAFLYLEKSSSVAVCGWIMANPGNSSASSHKAVQMLLAAMPDYARRHGAKYLLTTFGNRAVNKIADRLGFITGEKAENKFFPL